MRSGCMPVVRGAEFPAERPRLIWDFILSRMPDTTDAEQRSKMASTEHVLPPKVINCNLAHS
jgi:hypothetical protein